MNLKKIILICLFLIVPNSLLFGSKPCRDSFKIQLRISETIEKPNHPIYTIQKGTDSLESIYRLKLANEFSQAIETLVESKDWDILSENARAQKIAARQLELEFKASIQLKNIQSTRMKSYQKSLSKLDPKDPDFQSKGISILSSVKPNDILNSNVELWIHLSKRLKSKSEEKDTLLIEFDPWLHNY